MHSRVVLVAAAAAAALLPGPRRRRRALPVERGVGGAREAREERGALPASKSVIIENRVTRRRGASVDHRSIEIRWPVDWCRSPTTTTNAHLVVVIVRTPRAAAAAGAPSSGAPGAAASSVAHWPTLQEFRAGPPRLMGVLLLSIDRSIRICLLGGQMAWGRACETRAGGRGGGYGVLVCLDTHGQQDSNAFGDFVARCMGVWEAVWSVLSIGQWRC